MQLSREECLRRFHERDPKHDGSFVVGVTSTGIYCLPSCPARRPKPENVRFFASEDPAREAGLRACRRCRPDQFYSDFDPDRERIEALAARVRRRPADFASAGALARAAGVGHTKLNELFHRELHDTPAAYLQRARVRAAARALVRGSAVTAAGLDAGFESASAYHEAFRRHMALAPGAYAKLGREFTLRLPPDYRPEDLFGLFGRDVQGRTERIETSPTRGGRATRRAAKALVVNGQALRLELTFTPTRVRCTFHGGRASRGLAARVHEAALRMIGLDTDPGPFERRALRGRGSAAATGMRTLVRRRPGLRIPQTSDAFEGLVWVIVGQQVNLSFASTCRARLIELAGRPLADDFVAHPTADEVAALDYDDLMPLQFSRRKAEYVIDTARQVAAGELDLEGLRHATVGRTRATLSAVRGLGPWSIQYLLMRSFGYQDCVPVGDAALRNALRRFYELEHAPDADETLACMAPFAPYRSFATFHLWRSLADHGDDA